MPAKYTKSAKDSGAPSLASYVEGMHPSAQAEQQVRFLRARLEWASKPGSGVTEKEIAALSGQLTSATRLHARLAGALDITESQIVRSVPFQRLMRCLKEALSVEGKVSALDVWERVMKVIDEAVDGGRAP